MLQKLGPYNPCFQISQSILGPTLYSLKKKKITRSMERLFKEYTNCLSQYTGEHEYRDNHLLFFGSALKYIPRINFINVTQSKLMSTSTILYTQSH